MVQKLNPDQAYLPQHL